MPKKPTDNKPSTKSRKSSGSASHSGRKARSTSPKPSARTKRSSAPSAQKKPTRPKARAKSAGAKAKTKASRGNILRSLIKRLLLWSLLALLVVTLLWVLALDYQVRAKFSGKKWSIPARVYARPMEIYQGMTLRQDELNRELSALGYQSVKRIQQPGQYSRYQGAYDIYTRDFTFPDKAEQAARYRLRIENNTVVSLSGAEDDLVLRIEPKEIGSIYPRDGEDRVLVSLDAVPPLLAESLIAVEDKEFARHYGISLKGIARAMLANIKAGRFVQGGSTLTQQLVKNFYLNQRRHLWRKVQEAVMSLLLELHYSKAEILEAYINEVYLGQSGPRGIHGFGLAAQHYFNKPLTNLKPQQIALLVSTVKGASYYNPWRFPERAKARRNVVLQLMADSALITESQRKVYAAKPLGVVDKSRLRLGDYPAFLDLVKRQLRRDYREEDLQSEGLRIFTTMSPNVQELTEQVVSRRLASMNKARKKVDEIQAAAIVTAVGSGEILAVVGDRDPRYQGFNRSLDIRRPVGSLVKPFVYLTALQASEQYTLASLLDDSPVNMKLPNGQQWQPQNFSKDSHGQVLLYDALAQSYNQSTVHLGMSVGLDEVIETLQAMGLEQSPKALPSLLLGSLELSPLEVSHLYHTLAADGVYTPLRAIRSVLNAQHQPLQRYPLASEPKISEASSYLMHYSLQAVMQAGTGRRAYQSLPNDLIVGGKTGTTNQQRDSWFAGYSGNHLGVVWIGNDSNRRTPYTGSSGALPVWTDIFRQLSTGSIANDQPASIEYYWIDSRNGLLSAEKCDGAMLMPFIAGTQPEQATDCEWAQPTVKRWFNQWFGNNGNSNDNSNDSGNDQNTPANIEQEDGN